MTPHLETKLQVRPCLLKRRLVLVRVVIVIEVALSGRQGAEEVRFDLRARPASENRLLLSAAGAFAEDEVPRRHGRCQRTAAHAPYQSHPRIFPRSAHSSS